MSTVNTLRTGIHSAISGLAGLTTIDIYDALRVGTQIIKIAKKDEPVVLIPNNISPDQVLADRLKKGLTAQGASVSPQADTQLKLIVQNMQAEVTKPGMAYKTRVKLEVKLPIVVEREWAR